MSLNTKDVSNVVQVLYVWIDGTGQTLRCKTKSMESEPKSANDCPVWNYDGSSTAQAEGTDSDVYLHPRAIFPDPFRGLPNKMVLCETCTWDKKPTNTNFRMTCNQVHETPDVKVSRLYIAVPVTGLTRKIKYTRTVLVIQLF